ncbi:LTA synthase family protein [Erythrobacter sp. WG]|uniref:LTA synthase family protein n=1 Tax=Erythrobacter sp. WG TaxID=2985510 RepID=UPI0022721E5F|nr:LTA synthase family protein [Erythrobacter sp. WG]MCX9145728.1 LTA synthase family protein [Erythrobacter sp. WG]
MNDLLRELALGAPILALLVVIGDLIARPRPLGRLRLRRPAGTLVLLLVSMLAFAVLLVVTGVPLVAGIGTSALVAVHAVISNIKRKVLGEPLVFSDFALIGAVFQHPQFYVSALRPWQLAALAAGVAGLAAIIALFAAPDLVPRLAGAGLGVASWIGLRLALPPLARTLSAPVPDPEIDVARLGLIPAVLAQWADWRGTTDPQPCTAAPIGGAAGQLVVIVQCESFTDPVALFGDPAIALPGLAAARRDAWQTGRLNVPGFGAYTMRTEYGVLFGRAEEQLGTRRFDPFLTARGEASWALPNRLDRNAWDSWFVHPHDMRFYGRDRLMPASGFGALVGEDAFPPPQPGEGRYVTDAAVADRILDLAATAPRAGLIYAVTIENHGPWPAGGAQGEPLAAPYIRLLRHSDAMLTRLWEGLARLGRPVTLCFFGDHRPSIPGASEPGAEHHTPYVILRLAADGTPLGAGRQEVDLTPAELHHTLLAAIASGEAQAEQDAVA